MEVRFEQLVTVFSLGISAPWWLLCSNIWRMRALSFLHGPGGGWEDLHAKVTTCSNKGLEHIYLTELSNKVIFSHVFPGPQQAVSQAPPPRSLQHQLTPKNQLLL